MKKIHNYILNITKYKAISDSGTFPLSKPLLFLFHINISLGNINKFYVKYLENVQKKIKIIQYLFPFLKLLTLLIILISSINPYACSTYFFLFIKRSLITLQFSSSNCYAKETESSLLTAPVFNLYSLLNIIFSFIFYRLSQNWKYHVRSILLLRQRTQFMFSDAT